MHSQKLIAAITVGFALAATSTNAATTHSYKNSDNVTVWFTVDDDGYALLGAYRYDTGRGKLYHAMEPVPKGSFTFPAYIGNSSTGVYPVRGANGMAFPCGATRWLTEVHVPAFVDALGVNSFRNQPIERVFSPSLSHWLEIKFTGAANESHNFCGSNGNWDFYAGNPAQKVVHLEVPGDAQGVPSYAFRGCGSLETLMFPSTPANIGEYAFAECPNLRSVNFGNGVTNIANQAFFNCTNLESIAFSPNLKGIGYAAFEDCTSLRTLEFPDGTESVGGYAFRGCTSLTHVLIPVSVTNITSYGKISNTQWSAGTFLGCTGIVDVTMPEKYGAKSLFPSSYTNIKTIRLANGSKTVGNANFFQCSSLETIFLPASVETVEPGTFYGINTLKTVYLHEDSPLAEETLRSVGRLSDSCVIVRGNAPQYAPVTLTTPVPVEYEYLRTSAMTILAAANGDYEAAANAMAANGVNKVWECYVAGLNPTNATDVFRTVISMEDGASIVGWNPDLNEGGAKHERVYTVEGRESLTGGDWGPTNAASRFFRVKVSMP